VTNSRASRWTAPCSDAFVELAGAGTVADVGCGPGHLTRFLAARRPDVIGVDVSPGMIAVARERAPELTFVVASMLQLPVQDGTWAGVLAMYSVIHLVPEERVGAWQEIARSLRPNGWLLVSFHVDSAEYAAGQVSHLTSWFDEPVDIDGYFLDPAEMAAELEAAGFQVVATLERQPIPTVEYPSRRCYLLAQRR